MPKVKMQRTWRVFAGTTKYADYCLYSESENPYDMDRWTLYLDRYAVVCSADRQIIQVDGYLPDHNWRRTDHIIVPEALADANFVIDEEFDASGRDVSEDVRLDVEISPQQRVVRICIAGVASEKTARTFVSPHENLLVGATTSEPMLLTEFLFLTVAGIEGLEVR